MSDDPRDLDIRAALRLTVREERLKRGWSQEALNQEMRRIGFSDWTRQTVASIESDPPTRRVLLSELVGLASLFRLPLAALVLPPGVSSLRLEGGGQVAARTVREALSGQIPHWRGRQLGPPAGWEPSDNETAQDEALLGRLERDAKGELERYIAGKLGVQPLDVVTQSYKAWGHSATDERDWRASESGRPKRGVSRDILDELSGRGNRE